MKTSGASPSKNTASPGPDIHYRSVLDASISDALARAIRMIAADPSLAFCGMRILSHQKKAAALRKKYERDGILVPAAMLVSVTSRCNLSCHGCYQKAGHATIPREMDTITLNSLVYEAAELGISIVVVSGGEPLLRKTEILALAHEFPQILFPVFTNGLAIDDALSREFAARRNIVPVVSFEGFRDETDTRRGPGVYDRLRAACAHLKTNGIFFGCSVTVTRVNSGLVTSDRFVREMIEAGARVFVFVEYVPVEPGTDDLVLDFSRQKDLHAAIDALDKKYPALFFGFPGEEAQYGGCLAAGRGFVHVNPAGDLEACPAAPFSDTNIARVPLREALKSPLLAEIRLHHGLLTETTGGCALWKNREWVQVLTCEKEKTGPDAGK
ncbi:MAG: radical SAM protein [Methanoregula sp.]|nr:radical SAM protein [Methanoregula sp.]